ncbi:MAG: hypothetical protein R3A46_10540 [Thermomicrobiales bacterium]
MTATETIAEVKERIAREAQALHPRLIQISQGMHANPEIAFQEHEAMTALTNELEEHGFEVERGWQGSIPPSSRPTAAASRSSGSWPNMTRSRGWAMPAATI